MFEVKADGGPIAVRMEKKKTSLRYFSGLKQDLTILLLCVYVEGGEGIGKEETMRIIPMICVLN